MVDKRGGRVWLHNLKKFTFFLTSEKAISEQRGLSTHGETIIRRCNDEQRVNLDKEDEQSEN